MKNNIVDSFNCAIEGIVHVIKTQKNMRLHALAGVCIFILGILMGLNRVETIVLSISIILVLFAEMFNTCMELTIDLITHTYHPLARVIKDVSAGMVLLSCINALIVGYVFFIKPLVIGHVKLGLDTIRGVPWYLTLICLTIVITIVVAMKLVFHKGTPLRGGMPSGHSAVAFSIWTIVWIVTQNPLITLLVFLLAFFVARSRLVKNIHSLLEVLAGAVVGVLVTVLVFQIVCF